MAKQAPLGQHTCLTQHHAPPPAIQFPADEDGWRGPTGVPAAERLPPQRESASLYPEQREAPGDRGGSGREGGTRGVSNRSRLQRFMGCSHCRCSFGGRILVRAGEKEKVSAALADVDDRNLRRDISRYNSYNGG